MKKFQKPATILLAVIMIASLLSAIYIFGTAEQINARNANRAAQETGVPGQDGDVDVPIAPTKTVRSISVYVKPTKLSYLRGEALDLSGMVVKATYSDSSTGIVSGYEVSAFDPDITGKQTIIVSLGNKTASFQVAVYDLGDANGDFTVDQADAELLVQYAAGWDVYIESLPADVTGDGVVNGEDATLMLQYVAGWEVTLG